MELHSSAPLWLSIVSWVYLGLSMASALYILADIYILGYRQKMKIMNIVHPITGLYFGPLAVWFYLKYGRPKSPESSRQPALDDKVHWYQVAEGVTHCGAGCTLGDIIGEWFVFVIGLTIFGHAIYADYIFDFALAWLLGIAFQYFTIVPMRGLSPLKGVWVAIKADTFSIVSFQIGLFAGMFIYQMLIFGHPLAKDSAAYWFLMQISMIIGFFTAYPVNYLLIKKGLKEKM